MEKNISAIILSRAGGKAGIFMAVNSKGRNQKIMAVESAAGCNTASGIWGCGPAAGRHVSRLRAGWMAMIHLTAFQTIVTAIAAAGKRMGKEQTDAKNQDQRYAQAFIRSQRLYV